MFGREVWPDDFATVSRGQKVYLAWPVPHCAETCAPHYLGDGMCDKGCNTTLCNFDMGDCIGNDVKTRHGWGGGGGYGDDEESETPKCNEVGVVQVGIQSTYSLKAALFQPLNLSSHFLVSSLCFAIQLVPLRRGQV
jgi:hypothetical protein